MPAQYFFFVTSIVLLLVQQFIPHNSAAIADLESNKNGFSLQEDKCATWHYRDHNGLCQCYPQNVSHMPVEWIRCLSDTVILVYGNCMTYDEDERSTYAAECPYFQVGGHKVSSSDPGYIELPLNISKLNEYMCGSENRKGFLCSECTKGFGTSFTSIEYSCSNCTNSYGIYLHSGRDCTTDSILFSYSQPGVQ